MHLLDICCVRDTDVGILESKINTFLKQMWYSKLKGANIKILKKDYVIWVVGKMPSST